MIKADKELDVRGLNCPLPLLRTKKMLSQMNAGEVIKVLATDPAADIDFTVYSEVTGNKIISSKKTKTEMVFFLQKKA